MKKCKYCGTTENLVVSKVGNSKNKLREQTLNLCEKCRNVLASKAGSHNRKKDKELLDFYSLLQSKFKTVIYLDPIIHDYFTLHVFVVENLGLKICIVKDLVPTSESISISVIYELLGYYNSTSKYLIYFATIPNYVSILESLPIVLYSNTKAILNAPPSHISI